MNRMQCPLCGLAELPVSCVTSCPLQGILLQAQSPCQLPQLTEVGVKHSFMSSFSFMKG